MVYLGHFLKYFRILQEQLDYFEKSFQKTPRGKIEYWGNKVQLFSCESQSALPHSQHTLDKGWKDQEQRFFEASIPTKAAELRSVPGLPGYYQSFEMNWADICEVAHAKTSVKRSFEGTSKMHEAFGYLNGRLAKPPELGFPDCDYPFVVTDENSSVALWVFISQKKVKNKFYRFNSPFGPWRNRKAATRQVILILEYLLN